MHMLNFILLGKIDMFLMLRGLLRQLLGFLDEKCTHSTQFFGGE